MENQSTVGWVVAIILGVMWYQANKDAQEFNKHSLSRLQYIETNLVSANQKINNLLIGSYQACYNTVYGQSQGLCGIKQDIDNALVDVRPELTDLHKKLKDK